MMITIKITTTMIFPFLALGKKKDDTVDKGTNREKPGDSGGERPPKKDEYKDTKGKKERK